MDKQKVLDAIFNDDEFDILNVKPKVSSAKNEDERLVISFAEINEFVSKNNKEPQANSRNIAEFQLYSRLKKIRENTEKTVLLENQDVHGLLSIEKKEINSLEDIFNDDTFDLLDDDTDLFDFKHTPKDYDRAATDFVARRKPCAAFHKYEPLFKEIQKDLVDGKRKLVDFNESQLKNGNYFVHNGILLYLHETIDVKKDKFGKDDGRTRIIFENGTESSMKLRSLGKNLFANGKAITEDLSIFNQKFLRKFNNITEEDEEAGFIYVLKSKTKDERILSIDNLFKIGYSKDTVEERIKNAEKDPTYLMAQVRIITTWKCYNMNPQKLEQLLHNFFGKACLNIDVFDENKKRHTPREWFIAPIEVIEQAIELIITGAIINYFYDQKNQIIIKK
jgi:hypothetical protein